MTKRVVRIAAPTGVAPNGVVDAAQVTQVVDRLSGDHLGFGYLDLTPLLQSPTFRDLDPSKSLAARGRLAYSLAFAAGPERGMRALVPPKSAEMLHCLRSGHPPRG